MGVPVSGTTAKALVLPSPLSQPWSRCCRYLSSSCGSVQYLNPHTFAKAYRLSDWGLATAEDALTVHNTPAYSQAILRYLKIEYNVKNHAQSNSLYWIIQCTLLLKLLYRFFLFISLQFQFQYIFQSQNHIQKQNQQWTASTAIRKIYCISGSISCSLFCSTNLKPTSDFHSKNQQWRMNLSGSEELLRVFKYSKICLHHWKNPH